MYNYTVSTMNIKRIIKALAAYLHSNPPKNLKQFLWLFLAISFECVARVLATLEFYILRKLPYKWKVVK